MAIVEAIYEIWNLDGTPRLVVDSLRPGVDVPDEIKKEWGRHLIIDLDRRCDIRGFAIYATFCFVEGLHRCRFPFHAIEMIEDRGRGVVYRKPKIFQRRSKARLRVV